MHYQLKLLSNNDNNGNSLTKKIMSNGDAEFDFFNWNSLKNQSNPLTTICGQIKAQSFCQNWLEKSVYSYTF
jgi:hypothetical protein